LNRQGAKDAKKSAKSSVFSPAGRVKKLMFFSVTRLITLSPIAWHDIPDDGL
jgi:hypothetical protein